MIRRSTKLPDPTISLLLAASLALVLAGPLAAECTEVHTNRIPNPEGSRIRVVTENAGAPIEEQAIEDAIAMWTDTCAAATPRFGSQGNIVMRLRFHDGPNDIDGCGDGCACTLSNTLPAAEGDYLASSITHLFERHRDGGGHCRAHRAETLAHEIGHVLGFRHPDDPYNPACRGLIMSFSPHRSVQQTDCAALAALWRPPHRFGKPERQRFRWLPRAAESLVEGIAPPPTAETEGALESPPDR